MPDNQPVDGDTAETVPARKAGRPRELVAMTHLGFKVPGELYDRILRYAQARHRGNLSEASRELLEDALHFVKPPDHPHA